MAPVTVEAKSYTGFLRDKGFALPGVKESVGEKDDKYKEMRAKVETATREYLSQNGPVLRRTLRGEAWNSFRVCGHGSIFEKYFDFKGFDGILTAVLQELYAAEFSNTPRRFCKEVLVYLPEHEPKMKMHLERLVG
ncbi:MAG: hypothetical protein HY513_04640 [Candidatus Aenigmarchaeota archaeon]|nr:hypothetical protein [Candidatus Aenigmarchaeota archaeon]